MDELKTLILLVIKNQAWMMKTMAIGFCFSNKEEVKKNADVIYKNCDEILKGLQENS